MITRMHSAVFLIIIFTSFQLFAQAGNCLDFDGYDDYVSLPSNINLSSSSFTFECWFKLKDLNPAGYNGYAMVSVGSTSGSNYNDAFLMMSVQNLGFPFPTTVQLDYGFYGADQYYTWNSPDLNWHHFAFTFNNATKLGTVYLDGSSVASHTFSNVLNGTGAANIGRDAWNSGSDNCNGEIDEIRIWNVERSPTEISNNYQNLSLSASTSGLLAYYHFDQGTGGTDNSGLTTLTDATANSYTGNLNNFALNGSLSNWETSNNTALPVELASFNAQVNDNVVTLSWQTATEVNNHGFEVQRSAVSSQQSANWEKVGFVDGAGNSNSPKSYSFTDQPNGGNSFSYRIKQIDNDGKLKFYDPITVSLASLSKPELMQNSPNPFNPSTTIKFYIPDNSDVSIKIYDILGREVNTLINKQVTSGYHIVYWNGMDKYGNQSASGTYIYRLIASSSGPGQTFVQTKKMILLK